MDISKKLQALININSDNRWKVSVFKHNYLSMNYCFMCFDGKRCEVFKIWCDGCLENDGGIKLTSDEIMILPSLSNLIKNNYKNENRKRRREHE